jgi:hypothetical protein
MDTLSTPQTASNTFEALHPLTKPRDELKMLRARYDSGAVSQGVYAAIRQLEIDCAWREHR